MDIKQHWTMLRHWSQFVPKMSTDIRGHQALHHHHQVKADAQEPVCESLRFYFFSDYTGYCHSIEHPVTTLTRQWFWLHQLLVSLKMSGSFLICEFLQCFVYAVIFMCVFLLLFFSARGLLLGCLVCVFSALGLFALLLPYLWNCPMPCKCVPDCTHVNLYIVI